ncbi:Tryptophan--tRNA ligase, mitochondrial [Ascosphaera pollenicola]|nr:Tryptophan--tRNA ligase, mitochondrial [Ascosphaera pollenicola]
MLASDKVISDSYTRVKASFSKEAIQDFVIEMQKPLSRGTKGAVITVHDFDLIIRAGDDDDEEEEEDDDDDVDDVGDAIIIVIKEFELEGCEGSREYGRPENVVSISPIRALLDELLARRRRKHDVGPVDEIGATVTITPEDVAIPREQEKQLLHTRWADGSIDIESEPPVPRKLWEKWDELVLEHVRQKMDEMSVEVGVEVDEGLTSSMPFGSQEKLKMSIYGDGDGDGDSQLSDKSESESRAESEPDHVAKKPPPPSHRPCHVSVSALQSQSRSAAVAAPPQADGYGRSAAATANMVNVNVNVNVNPSSSSQSLVNCAAAQPASPAGAAGAAAGGGGGGGANSSNNNNANTANAAIVGPGAGAGAGSGSGSFAASASASASSPPPLPSSSVNTLALASTILKSCPMYDTIAILIFLLQLPPIVLTLVQFLFASLTFMPPAGISTSALTSNFDIFQGPAGTPSLSTMIAMDAFCLLVWGLFMWTWAQNFAIDLAQVQVAITLGGGSSEKNGGVNLLCVLVVLALHLLRSQGVQDFVLTRLLSAKVVSAEMLAKIAAVIPADLRSQVAADREPPQPPTWLRSLLAVHILAQAGTAMARRSMAKNRSPVPSKGKRGGGGGGSAGGGGNSSSNSKDAGGSAGNLDTEAAAGSGSHLDSSAFESSSASGIHSSYFTSSQDIVPTTSSTSHNNNATNTPPAIKETRERLSSAKKRRRQANQVRSRQPFWAALASTKVTVMREYEHSRLHV